MAPTLLPGDVILVNKILFGPRIHNYNRLKDPDETRYIRLKSRRKIRKNDVVVFNLPLYHSFSYNNINTFGTLLVKRCIAASGDSISIKKKVSQHTKNNSFNIFPYDTSLHWTLDNYGPFYVPSKGDNLILTPENVRLYKSILLYENNRIEIRNDSAFSMGTHINNHLFESNYYFMIGDNFYQSNDSRYWGFVPEINIIGKCDYVLFSIDKSMAWFKKFRWERFFKKIS